MTLGISVQSQTRAKKPMRGWLRAYPAVLRGGELRCTGGCWEKRAATDEPKQLIPSKRLFANLGDRLIVIGSDVAAVVITAITAPGFLETWRVRVIDGQCADGNVQVMATRRMK